MIFENARLKLTVWYLLIIMVISLFFSLVIYNSVNEEFVRFEHMQQRISENFEKKFIAPLPGQNGPKSIIFTQEDQNAVKHARVRFLLSLGIINLIILVGSGIAGYFLAGRTLQPIKEMVDEQNRFVSDSSHELRTPLTSLRSEIEVALRNKKLTTENAIKVLKSNLEEVISLQRLSDNLLELAQNGKLVNKNAMETVSLRNIIQSAIKKIEPVAKRKQIKIETDLQDIKIHGISDRLTEVFVILLDNAVKYSRKKGKIEISSKKLKEKTEIAVTDYGMGISKEDLPHIFDRFYRSDKSRSEDGYGLGLSIAKKITQSHKGFIDVSSTPDKHTTFTVTLAS